MTQVLLSFVELFHTDSSVNITKKEQQIKSEFL